MEVMKEGGIGRAWKLISEGLDFSEKSHQIGLWVGRGDGGDGFFQLDQLVEQTLMQRVHARSVAVSDLNSSHLENRNKALNPDRWRKNRPYGEGQEKW